MSKTRPLFLPTPDTIRTLLAEVNAVDMDGAVLLLPEGKDYRPVSAKEVQANRIPATKKPEIRHTGNWLLHRLMKACSPFNGDGARQIGQEIPYFIHLRDISREQRPIAEEYATKAATFFAPEDKALQAALIEGLTAFVTPEKRAELKESCIASSPEHSSHVARAGKNAAAKPKRRGSAVRASQAVASPTTSTSGANVDGWPEGEYTLRGRYGRLLKKCLTDDFGYGYKDLCELLNESSGLLKPVTVVHLRNLWYSGGVDLRPELNEAIFKVLSDEWVKYHPGGSAPEALGTLRALGQRIVALQCERAAARH